MNGTDPAHIKRHQQDPSLEIDTKYYPASFLNLVYPMNIADWTKAFFSGYWSFCGFLYDSNDLNMFKVSLGLTHTLQTYCKIL